MGLDYGEEVGLGVARAVQAATSALQAHATRAKAELDLPSAFQSSMQARNTSDGTSDPVVAASVPAIPKVVDCAPIMAVSQQLVIDLDADEAGVLDLTEPAGLSTPR